MVGSMAGSLAAAWAFVVLKEGVVMVGEVTEVA